MTGTSAGHRVPRDLVLRGGKVLTLDLVGPTATATATALLLRGGEVAAVGDERQVLDAAGPEPRVLDLRGRTVMPGFVDAHCHFEEAGMDGDTVSFRGATTMAEALERVRTTARSLDTDAWVRGQIWNPVLQLEEGRVPTLAELDAVGGGRPVYLPMGHSACANSAALRLAGIDETTPDPDGGRLGRDPGSGTLTGYLWEEAQNLVARVVPEWTEQERAGQLLTAMKVLNGWGITSVVAGAMHPRDVAVLGRLAREGRSTLRVAAMVLPSGELIPSVSEPEWESLVKAGPRRYGDGTWVRDLGIKLQLDGGMTLGTAATRKPHLTDSAYAGDLLIDRSRLAMLVSRARQRGWRVGVHVVGDAAIDLALDVFAEARTAGAADPGPDILIHASLMQEDQMERARDLGVMVTAQAPFLWRNRDAIAARMGPDRAEGAVPLRSMTDVMGIDRVSAGTDFPINDLNPFKNLYAMTTRRDRQGRTVGGGQAVGREEALRLYTTSGAAHTGEERTKGALRVGALADLVVLDGDPLAADPETLLALNADVTVVGGHIVFDRHGELTDD
ncbi:MULTISPECIES: amidohydrolase [Streptomyces]|uniref:Amidohydrolase n=1 Tax=Streptomyces mordarskii TaxID=1226758 RepID=A0ABN1CQ07_9ACTN|nr:MULTISPECIES: amidohydrolase [Streptomyces]QTI90251.1 amidohydrolase [Streptomyces sp. AgN23]RSS45538.1 amidohydrolase [Streptomyces sp. WAC05858]WJD96342.1 amidohydrolase [Streptomyces antimycoticus]WTA86370.1 amidohydrolase [Streptomyces antimycoticus]WTB03072.1 amidohydrolase [Streptomyces antimycoticus]